MNGIVAWSNARLNGRETESVAAIVPIYQPEAQTLNQCLNMVLPQVDEIIVTGEGLSKIPTGAIRHPRVKYVQNARRKSVMVGT